MNTTETAADKTPAEYAENQTTPTGSRQEATVEAGVNTHSHIREGDETKQSLIVSNMQGGFDVIGPQPNAEDGLTTAKQVLAYIENARDLIWEITQFHECAMSFIPFVMLTEQTTEREIAECVDYQIRDGKMYPFMRTTKSEKGIKQWGKMLPAVKWCAKYGMKVHGHFEHPNLLYSDRDAEFICLPVVEMFLQETEAHIFWEHGSDGRCVPYWTDFANTGRFFVTLTAHHLATNEDKARRDVRAECKPTIKTEQDRVALVRLVSENYPWVMAGADDAPHSITAKHVPRGQCACGDATSWFLMQLYAHSLEHLFATDDGIETFVNFTGRNARGVHSLPPASRSVKLVRKPFAIPDSYAVGLWKVEPFWAGETLNWSIEE